LKQDTKQKILEAGAELIHSQGFNNTGIAEVLKAAGVPKGSFYFYFENKEDFGLQLLDYFREFYIQSVRQFLEDQSLPYLERLRRTYDWFLDYFKAHGFRRGCPVGNIAQEMSDINPAFRDKLNQAVRSMTGIVEQNLIKAQQAGELDPKKDARELARFIISSWEGCLILMKVEQKAEPMEMFDRMVFENLLA
jgi:TetR/AcrR family transcriptional repressor of nem operon